MKQHKMDLKILGCERSQTSSFQILSIQSSRIGKTNAIHCDENKTSNCFGGVE